MVILSRKLTPEIVDWPLPGTTLLEALTLSLAEYTNQPAPIKERGGGGQVGDTHKHTQTTQLLTKPRP